MNFSLSISEEMRDFSEIRAAEIGFKSFAAYIDFALRLLNEQDKKSFEALNFYSDPSRLGVAPGKFLHLLLLDHAAREKAEYDVFGEPQNSLFYLKPDSTFMTGDEFSKTRYEKYKKGYCCRLTQY